MWEYSKAQTTLSSQVSPRPSNIAKQDETSKKNSLQKQHDILLLQGKWRIASPMQTFCAALHFLSHTRNDINHYATRFTAFHAKQLQ